MATRREALATTATRGEALATTATGARGDCCRRMTMEKDLAILVPAKKNVEIIDISSSDDDAAARDARRAAKRAARAETIPLFCVFLFFSRSTVWYRTPSARHAEYTLTLLSGWHAKAYRSALTSCSFPTCRNNQGLITIIETRKLRRGDTPRPSSNINYCRRLITSLLNYVIWRACSRVRVDQ